jgi:hypothetical protein
VPISSYLGKFELYIGWQATAIKEYIRRLYIEFYLIILYDEPKNYHLLPEKYLQNCDLSCNKN